MTSLSTGIENQSEIFLVSKVDVSAVEVKVACEVQRKINSSAS
jgi:hypothetical protein